LSQSVGHRLPRCCCCFAVVPFCENVQINSLAFSEVWKKWSLFMY
jgi:hypothetical protein